MVDTREKFFSQADPELLEGMREIARREGRHFQAVLEDAMSAYIESKNQERVLHVNCDDSLWAIRDWI